MIVVFDGIWCEYKKYDLIWPILCITNDLLASRMIPLRWDDTHTIVICHMLLYNTVHHHLAEFHFKIRVNRQSKQSSSLLLESSCLWILMIFSFGSRFSFLAAYDILQIWLYVNPGIELWLLIINRSFCFRAKIRRINRIAYVFTMYRTGNDEQ